MAPMRARMSRASFALGKNHQASSNTSRPHLRKRGQLWDHVGEVELVLSLVCLIVEAWWVGEGKVLASSKRMHLDPSTPHRQEHATKE
jgi:hypothetical protein